MYCKNCGHEIDDNCKYCPDCGASQQNSSSFDYQYSSTEDFHTEPGYNSICIIGCVLACASVFINMFGTLSVAGLILSIIGLKKQRETQEKGKVFAIVGIAVSIATLVYTILAVLLFLGVTNTMTSMTGLSIL